MFKQIIAFVTVASLLLMLNTYSNADAPTQTPQEIKQQVASVMELAKQNNLSGCEALSKDGDAVLPYLEPYLNASDWQVRLAIVNTAGYIGTASALKMLTKLVDDGVNGVGTNAVSELSYRYDNHQIVSVGGQPLIDALLKYEDDNGPDLYAIFLLGCFQGDARITEHLSQVRPHIEAQIKASPPDSTLQRHYAEKELALDMALANRGDQSAITRISSLAGSDNIADLIFVLENIKYVDTQKILLGLVASLKDKRVGLTLRVTAQAPPRRGVNGEQQPSLRNADDQASLSFRICDIALVCLANKAHIDIGIPDIGYYRHFSDTELSTAYLRLSAYYSKASVGH